MFLGSGQCLHYFLYIQLCPLYLALCCISIIVTVQPSYDILCIRARLGILVGCVNKSAWCNYDSDVIEHSNDDNFACMYKQLESACLWYYLGHLSFHAIC